MSTRIAYVDGTWFDDARDATIGVLDHGLLYGDGVFEGIRFYGGQPFALAPHLRRLRASARALLLDVPWSDEDLGALCREAADRTGLADGYLRLIVTRGAGALGVSPHTCERPTLILIGAPLTLYPADVTRAGIDVVTSALRRAAPDALPPQVKSLNYLTSVLAAIEARRQGAHEALLLDGQGRVAECTADNVFVVVDGLVRTPAAADGALRGITRDHVIDLLRADGIAVQEAQLVLADVWTADEAFLTGTGAEVVPVARVDGRAMGFSPGPITRRVQELFTASVRP
ncbi:branched-chain-amino-acid transaminase [Paraconexibacter sp.]|uniref:branched-chain-amino-acid transaminase n=1 Tax=Paraconexibacter sp. TaxID=2949640 RepID=UPI0035683416